MEKTRSHATTPVASVSPSTYLDGLLGSSTWLLAEDALSLLCQVQKIKSTDVTLGQVFAKRVSSTLTPLHEVVYKKWFFKRIITLGDSAHKPNPIGGQGGNGALESSAELINALVQMTETRNEGLSNLSDGDIYQIFSEVQSARHDRAQTTVSRSHLTQPLLAYEYPVLSTF
ncbi:hypothetical protein IL306_006278 [Fusarium sp. DS 682]|nr:hypothetical protein IL306_006278 [Fusarium sp. DS 682]